MGISTRTRAIVLSILVTLVFFIFQSVDLAGMFDISVKFDFIELGLITALMYLGVFWVVNFRVRGERFLTVLFFPALMMLILTLYIELIIDSVFGDVSKLMTQVLASMIVIGVAYVSILTANVLNVGFLEKIPLSQAGRAAHYVLTLISAYLFFSILFSNAFPVVVKVGAVFLIAYLLTSISLWTIDIRYNKRTLSSIAISLMMANFSFVLLIWPISSEYSALILSLVYYMALGIALEIREVLSARIWLEYGFLYTIIVFILFLISSWGINGRLL